MSAERRILRWGWAMVWALPIVASAQLSGEGIPDLSGIAGKASGSAVPAPRGMFSSGLKVPSVKPGEAAKSVGRNLREKIEAQSGTKQPALQQLENGMPMVLGQLEGQLEKIGLSKRDLGVAVAYAFVTSYEVATGKKVSTQASMAAARSIATATAKHLGPRFAALGPERQEEIYEKLLVAPMLLEGLHVEMVKAKKMGEAEGIRKAAADSFQTLFGLPATAVSIDAEGKIGRLVAKNGPPPAAATKTAVPTPAARLVPASIGGAQLFVRYRMQYGDLGGMMFDHLVMFPDGTAFDDVPNDPLPDFSVASLKRVSRPRDVGRWKIDGGRLALRFEGKTKSYVKDSSGGWAEPDHKSGRFNVYYPVKAATQAQLVGKWENKNLVTMGSLGGGAPMVAAGSNNGLVFAANGTFEKAGKRFASATTANMGDAFKSGGNVTSAHTGRTGSKGQWRLDGPLLTTIENGVRGVQLVFILPYWGKPTEPPEILIQGNRWARPGQG